MRQLWERQTEPNGTEVGHKRQASLNAVEVELRVVDNHPIGLALPTESPLELTDRRMYR
jgi:hypothetical protein